MTHPEAGRAVPRHLLDHRLQPDIIADQVLVAREYEDGDLGEDTRDDGDGRVLRLLAEGLVYVVAALDPGAGVVVCVQGVDDVFALWDGEYVRTGRRKQGGRTPR